MNNRDFIKKVNKEVWCTLAPSKIHGVGVFAIRNIPKGTVLFKGESEGANYFYLSEEEFGRIVEPIRNILIDRHLQCEGKEMWVCHPNGDAKLLCFMNHNDKPNSDGYKALTEIKAGEEVTENFIDIAGCDVLHRLTFKRMTFLK